MPQIPGSFSKKKAIDFVVGQGFTEQYDVGISGDGEHGSRLYYRRPGDSRGVNGTPEEHMTISRVGAFWFIFHFEKAPNDAR